MYFQMHINLTTVLEFSRQLTAYTRGASHFADKMDVIYLAYIMEKLIVFVDEFEDVRCLLYTEKKYHLSEVFTYGPVLNVCRHTLKSSF